MPASLACSVGEPHLFDESAGTLFKEDLCACWIGSKGIVTPLHFDTCHGLLAGVAGTKRVTLFRPEDTMYLYRRSSSEPNPNSSRADWELWRDGDGEARRRFPKLDEAMPIEVELGPGDMLYIPPGWWHTVAGATATVAVLLPFDMSPGEELHPSLMY